MAVAFRATGTYVPLTTAVAAVTLSAPAGMVAGDLILCSFALTNGKAVTPPTGMTAVPLISGVLGSTGSILYAYIGYWDGTATGYTFTWVGNTNVEGVTAAWSGVDQSAPIDANPVFAQSTTATATVTTGSIFPIAANSQLVTIFNADGLFATGATAPSGYTKETTGSGIRLLIADKTLAVSAPSGTALETPTASSTWSTGMLALRPAVAGRGAIVRSASTDNSFGGTASPAVPFGAAVGDIVIALVSADVAAVTTVTVPAGFTLLNSQVQTGPDGQQVNVYWKRLTAVDTGVYTFNIAATSTSFSASVVCLTGVHATNPPVIGTATQQTTAASSPYSIAATGITAVAQDVLLYLTAVDNVTSAQSLTWTAPSGYADVIIAPCAYFSPSYIAVKENATAGATGTVTATVASPGTAGWVNWMLQVPSATTGGSAFSGTATLAGNGTLTTTGTPAVAAPVAFSGVGTLAGNGSPTVANTGALSGAGSLSGGSNAFTGTATFTGAGSLIGSGTPQTVGTSALTGTGTATSSGTPTVVAAAPLSGTGTLSGGSNAYAGTANLTGTGTATASGATQISGTSPVSGAGTVTATGAPLFTSTPPLNGTGTLSTSSSLNVAGSASASGIGVLTVTSSPRFTGAINFSGTGTVSGGLIIPFRNITLKATALSARFSTASTTAARFATAPITPRFIATPEE